MENPERLRPYIDEFLERVFLTDSVLLYTPSQVALAATLHAASRASANLDNYVTDILFSQEHLVCIIEAVRSKYILFDLYFSVYLQYILIGIYNIYSRNKIYG